MVVFHCYVSSPEGTSQFDVGFHAIRPYTELANAPASSPSRWRGGWGTSGSTSQIHQIHQVSYFEIWAWLGSAIYIWVSGQLFVDTIWTKKNLLDILRYSRSHWLDPIRQSSMHIICGDIWKGMVQNMVHHVSHGNTCWDMMINCTT